MNKLKKLRESKNLSQQELADLIGSHQQIIASIENGTYLKSGRYYCGRNLRKRLIDALPELKMKDFIVKEK